LERNIIPLPIFSHGAGELYCFVQWLIEPLFFYTNIVAVYGEAPFTCKRNLLGMSKYAAA
jgi:hypothetical protein